MTRHTTVCLHTLLVGVFLCENRTQLFDVFVNISVFDIWVNLEVFLTTGIPKIVVDLIGTTRVSCTLFAGEVSQSLFVSLCQSLWFDMIFVMNFVVDGTLLVHLEPSIFVDTVPFVFSVFFQRRFCLLNHSLLFFTIL